ncbi:MAG: hypothetical protein HW416_3360 [Chloroflexi bacterium]|nr:hypothetical protein [Chloroflexota bacterium]
MAHVLIPVNDLKRAKSRLSSSLKPAERRDLVLAMLADVIAAVTAARIGQISVLSPDSEVLSYARSLGVQTIHEQPRQRGLNEALQWAIQSHLSGADEVLVLPADVPLVSVAELRAFRDSAGDLEDRPRSVSVAGTSFLEGTNGLWLRPPDVIPTQFGKNSFTRHLAATIFAGIDVNPLAVIPGLALDIDTSDDIIAFGVLSRRRMPTRTLKLLQRLGLVRGESLLEYPR